MKQRIITGLFGAVTFFYLMWLGGWWFTTFMFIASCLSFRELAKMFGLRSASPLVIFGYLLSAGWFLSMLNSEHIIRIENFTNIYIYVCIGLVLFCLCSLLNRIKLSTSLYLYLGFIYINLGFSLIMLEVWLPEGFFLLTVLLVAVWINDSAAYFTGKKYGRTKLLPLVSPNKTVEGSMAGVVIGALVGWQLYNFFVDAGLLSLKLPLGIWLLIPIIGQIGDLLESAIKRITGVKDSGSLLPGHGGVFDRFDSVLFTFIIFNLLGLI